MMLSVVGEARDASVPVGGLSVAVRDFGGPGPDVLLLHGAGCNLAHWSLVAPLLRDRFRLVSVDLPAHGKSPGPDTYSFDGDVEAVHAVRMALHLEDPAVVGHSYGGMLAVVAGRQGGYRAAVNIDGLGFAVAGSPPELRSPAEDQDEDEPPQAGDEAWLEREVNADELELAGNGVSAGLPAEVVRRGFRHGPDGLWHRAPPLGHFLTLVRFVDGLDLLGHYADTSCPTVTMVAARRDAPSAELAAAAEVHVRLVRAALTNLPGSSPARSVVDMVGGHYAHLEAPDGLARSLADVLR